MSMQPALTARNKMHEVANNGCIQQPQSECSDRSVWTDIRLPTHSDRSDCRSATRIKTIGSSELTQIARSRESERFNIVNLNKHWRGRFDNFRLHFKF